MSKQEFCTIESDPGVFSELISKMGAKGFQVEELFALDAQYLKELQPVFGLIFLFKWTPEKDDRQVMQEWPKDLFFARQVITNACATQAVLSVLMNTEHPKTSLGPDLTQYKEFTSSLDAENKGFAIGSCDAIRNAHNSFVRPEVFFSEDKKPATKEDDVFHFISYIFKNGKIYELDGLKKGPIELGSCSEQDWLDKIVPMIQDRINRYAQNEIKFNLLAVIQDRTQVYSEKIVEIQSQLQEQPSNQETLNMLLNEYKQKLQDEAVKMQRWTEENKRRRHNYVPFLVNLLKVLAEKKELIPLVEKAKAKKASKK